MFGFKNIDRKDVKSAARFSIGSFFILFLKICLLFFISRKFDIVPEIIVLISVFLPAFNSFTALGFHREFYKSYIAHELKSVRVYYNVYTATLLIWFSICLLILFPLLLVKGLNWLQIVSVYCICIADRILDEKIRLHFFRQKFLKWMPLTAIRTLGPLALGVCFAFQHALSFALVCLAYLLFVLYRYCPIRIFTDFSFPNFDNVKKSFLLQSSFSLAAVSRRACDKMLAFIFFDSQVSFTYNLIMQISSGSALIFEKFLQILERQSYLRTLGERIVVNRLPFILIGTFIAYLFILFDERISLFQDVEFIIIISCLYCWLLSIADRELEFRWWKGVKSASTGSLISLLLTTLAICTCYLLFVTNSLSVITLLLVVGSVPLVLLFYLSVKHS